MVRLMVRLMERSMDGSRPLRHRYRRARVGSEQLLQVLSTDGEGLAVAPRAVRVRVAAAEQQRLPEAARNER